MERAHKLFKKKMSYEFIFQHLTECESIKKGLLKDEKNISISYSSNKNINESANINPEIPSNETKKVKQILVARIPKER